MLSERERRVVDHHLKEAGMRDGARVVQWPGATSVFFLDTGKMWVHNNTPRKQAKQELYFHSVNSIASTITCAHPLKFWDLRRHATPREMARIQGFPESFILPRTCPVRLFGNAVAVPCATHAVSCVVEPTECVRHLDLCAGIGGFSIALKRATSMSRCVGYSEISPAAIKCFTANFPEAPSLGNAQDVESWPACDILTAGFPCQPFSVSNTRERRNKHRNREFFRVVLDAVRLSKATRIVLENVASIVNTGNEQWSTLCDTLRNELGFTLEYAVLDAKDFGVPQTRKRMYIIGRNDGIPFKSVKKFTPTPCVRLSSILEDL